MTQRRSRRTSALNSTMTDRVADVLRGMVLDGTLRPGQRLPIRDVSRALDVSVMPVREALIRLESLGLVKQFPHRGAIVATLTIDELNDLYTAREVVEPPVLQRGAAMLSTDDVADLGQIADELDDAVDRHDVAEVLRLDEMFLSVVYDATGNAALLKIISDLWNRVQPYKLLFFEGAQAGACEFIAADNRRLLGPLGDRNGDEAADFLRGTLRNAHLRLAAYLGTRADDGPANVPDRPLEELIRASLRRTE